MVVMSVAMTAVTRVELTVVMTVAWRVVWLDTQSADEWAVKLVEMRVDLLVASMVETKAES